MWNTIVLLRGEKSLTKAEFRSFNYGDTIWGTDSNVEELQKWNISDEDTAKEELKKYHCEYDCGNTTYIEEYALMYCEYDEDGEFVCGGDYELATMDKNSFISLAMNNGGLELYSDSFWIEIDADHSFFIPVSDIIQPIIDRIESDKNAPEWDIFFKQYIDGE